MKYAIPEQANRAMLILLLLLHGLVLFGLPSLLAHTAWWGLILLPMAWLNIVHWGLIHEAIHKLLLTNTRANEIGGRLLGIAMGPSFHVLRFGHLMHHQLNRKFHAEIVKVPTFAARFHYYAHLLCGLYLSEVIAGFLLVALPQRVFVALARATFLHDTPEVVISGERFFYTRGTIRPIRIDVMASLALYATAFYFYGAAWPWLLAFLTIRACVISFMDNIYHFDTPADNSKPAKELALPRPLSALILFGNFHETHHANSDVPWRVLPRIHAEQQRLFDGDFFTHGARQFAGPSIAIV